MEAAHKDVCQQCVAERSVEVVTIVKSFSTLKARRWQNIWRLDEKTVHMTENIER